MTRKLFLENQAYFRILVSIRKLFFFSLKPDFSKFIVHKFLGNSGAMNVQTFYKLMKTLGC